MPGLWLNEHSSKKIQWPTVFLDFWCCRLTALSKFRPLLCIHANISTVTPPTGRMKQTKTVCVSPTAIYSSCISQAMAQSQHCDYTVCAAWVWEWLWIYKEYIKSIHLELVLFWGVHVRAWPTSISPIRKVPWAEWAVKYLGDSALDWHVLSFSSGLCHWHKVI